MKNKDKKISISLKNNTPEIPDNISESITDILMQISQVDNKNKNRSKYKMAAVVVSAAIFTFVLIPNISTQAAYAMQDIPVVGKIVKAVTVSSKHVADEGYYEDIRVAELEGDDELQNEIDYINADIKELTDIAVKQFEDERKALEANGEQAYTGLDINYDVITNDDKWFTVKMTIFYAAGSSVTEQYFYHIDKVKGKTVTLSEIFEKDFDYVNIFSREIIKQMRNQMKKDESVMYWIDEKAANGFEFENINKEQNFYFDKEGNIVIVLNKYDAAPGYMGCPEFTIRQKLFKKYLI